MSYTNKIICGFCSNEIIEEMPQYIKKNNNYTFTKNLNYIITNTGCAHPFHETCINLISLKIRLQDCFCKYCNSPNAGRALPKPPEKPCRQVTTLTPFKQKNGSSTARIKGLPPKNTKSGNPLLSEMPSSLKLIFTPPSPVSVKSQPTHRNAPKTIQINDNTSAEPLDYLEMLKSLERVFPSSKEPQENSTYLSRVDLSADGGNALSSLVDSFARISIGTGAVYAIDACTQNSHAHLLTYGYVGVNLVALVELINLFCKVIIREAPAEEALISKATQVRMVAYVITALAIVLFMENRDA